MLVTPYVNLWGRRPAYICFTLIAIVSNVGSAYAKTYATIIVSRIFVGVGASVALAIGGATICDMFFQGERGRFMGFYALALTNGPHFGPIAGGFIALNLGWPWIFKINAIMLSVVLTLFIFTFPETLFSREQFSNLESKGYWSRMAFRGKVLSRKLTIRDFLGSFRMLKYLAIVIPCAYYMT